MKLNWQNSTHFPKNSNKKSVLTFVRSLVLASSTLVPRADLAASATTLFTTSLICLIHFLTIDCSTITLPSLNIFYLCHVPQQLLLAIMVMSSGHRHGQRCLHHCSVSIFLSSFLPTTLVSRPRFTFLRTPGARLTPIRNYVSRVPTTCQHLLIRGMCHHSCIRNEFSCNSWIVQLCIYMYTLYARFFG